MADFLEFLTHFQCQWSNSQMLRCPYRKVPLSFPVISCAAATTRKFINKMRVKYLGILSLNLNKLDKRVFNRNAILNEQKGS